MAMTNVSNELLYEVLKQVQADVADLKQMRVEMRDGFASVRSHLAASHGDQAFFERRLITLEADMDRIKRRLELVD